MPVFKYTITCLLLALLIACGGSSDDDAVLGFEEAWVRSAPPGANMSAAYGEFVNRTQRDIEPSSWSSPDFRDVSLHRTVMVDGVSRMRSAGDVIVAAGGSVLLEPGGLHLMLMGPTRKLVEGDTVRLVLVDANSARYEFDLPVVRR